MGLYDDENATVTSGDLDEETYWEAKIAYDQLEAALRTEQPWNAIADFLPRAIAKFDAVLKSYPNHEALKAWKAKAQSIDAKIDPKYNKDWKRGFAYAQGPYCKGWAALELARFYRKKTPPDWFHLREQSRKAETTLEKCFNVQDWPADVRTAFEAALTEAKGYAEESCSRLNKKP